MKQRSQAFRPAAPDPLEGRVVLSQVLFTPVTGIVAQAPQAEVALARTATIHEVGRTRLADGKVLTTATTITRPAPGETSTTRVTREPDGTSEVVAGTADTSGGTTTISKSITLPGGIKQSETGTDQAVASTTTILPDGTLHANPAATVIASRTTSFDHVIAQAGLGTETIVGTTVHEPTRGGSLSSTDQVVTHFDGSKDEVKIFVVARGRSSTTRTTTIAADGTTTSAVRTAHLISSTRS